jgi:uncharacterized protein YwgA
VITESSTHSERLAAIAYVVSAKKDVGKTKLQKLLYFGQEAAQVPLGYEFRLHHFGPYSFDLDDDLVRMKLAGIVSVEPDGEGYGFHVRPARISEGSSHVPAPSQRARAQLDRVIEAFGGMAAQELELRATIHFAFTVRGGSDEEVIAQVKRLKPKFAETVIRAALTELRSKNWLPKSVSPTAPPQVPVA